MSDVKKTVDQFVEELKKNPSNRFSKGDFQMLVYYILADSTFKSKKFMVRGDQILEDETSISDAMKKFMNKLLKHAGVSKEDERVAIIESFDLRIQDIDWVIDAVDEAMFIYTECGKNMRLFRAKMLQLTIQKMVRTGRYDGKITYKKKVVDRALDMARRKSDATS